jgi:hypothetical protein
MKNLTLWVGLLGLLLTPLAAQADVNWYKNCQSGVFSRTQNVSKGGFVCNNPTGNSLANNSNMLYVGECENVDLLFFPDLDGTNDDTDTLIVWSCPDLAPTDASGDAHQDATWSPTNICWSVEDTLTTPLTGDPNTNLEAIYGFAAVWIYVDPGATDTDTPRVIVKCNR